MLKYPLYFVFHGLGPWRDLIEADDVPAPDAYGPRLQNANENWVVQTYFELKRRGCDVRLVERMQPDALCFAHYDDIWLKELPLRSFIVGCRPDRPHAPLADIRVVQNKLAVRGPNNYFMPHWSQPGLLPRDAARGDRVERVVYFGLAYNLRDDFHDKAFKRALADMGMELEIREHPFHDYRNVDVVLAARPGTRYDIDLKPASKLQNAWLAGCPAVLGPESGFQQFRRSNLDYLEVATPEEALAALRRLTNDAALYRQMVENGFRRGAEYTHEKTAQRWIELFAGPVTEAFERWRKQRASWLWGAEVPRFAWRTLEHKICRYVHMWRI